MYVFDEKLSRRWKKKHITARKSILPVRERDAYNNNEIPFYFQILKIQTSGWQSNWKKQSISSANLALFFFLNSQFNIALLDAHKLWINNVSNNIGCDIYQIGNAVCALVYGIRISYVVCVRVLNQEKEKTENRLMFSTCMTHSNWITSTTDK